jgi:hypothetical protein
VATETLSINSMIDSRHSRTPPTRPEKRKKMGDWATKWGLDCQVVRELRKALRVIICAIEPLKTRYPPSLATPRPLSTPLNYNFT